MPFKQLSPVLDLKSVEETGVFSGYASVWNVVDSHREKTVPGSFAKSLESHRQRGSRPKFFWQHNPSEPLGKWLELKEDDHGLHVTGKLNLGVQRAREAFELLKEGDIDGLSIGYYPEDTAPDPKTSGVTMLKRINLVEVSIVSMGSCPDALISAVKSDRWLDMEEFARKLRDGEPPPPKDFEDILRDAGIPKSMAVRIASVGYARAIRSDSGGDDTAKSADLDAALQELRAAASGFSLTS